MSKIENLQNEMFTLYREQGHYEEQMTGKARNRAWEKMKHTFALVENIGQKFSNS